MSYISIVGEAYSEKVIEKSRFLTYCAHVEDEEEAKAFLARVRALHPLATHVCYGFVADRPGNLQRFSDDGEPQGTAGMPILNVIKAQKLVQTAVAVVRYFGGIKLGAGGLTRAYASSASEGLAAAERRTYEPCVKLRIFVDYPQVNAALRFLEGSEVLARDYAARAEFLVAVRAAAEERFLASLYDCLNGRVETREEGRCDYAFPARS